MASVTSSVGNSYNKSLQNDVINNWQNRTTGSERCQKYKIKLKTVGESHNSAASGAFINGMNSVISEANNDNCTLIT